MNTIYKICGLGLVALGLTACQSTPRSYNGATGYQVEMQNANSATLAYTLAGRQNQQLDNNKLQAACQKILDKNKTYKINVLSINEITNPTITETEFGRPIGNTRTTFGLSNTKDLYNNQDDATRQALNTRPSTLHVVRYTCN